MVNHYSFSPSAIHGIWFGSTVFWSLLVAFQAYITYEHFVRQRYRQMLLVIFLLISGIFRLVFYALASETLSGPVPEVLNRISLVTQSSALSVLFCLWFNFMLLQIKGNPNKSKEEINKKKVSKFLWMRIFFTGLNLLLYVGVFSTITDTDTGVYPINIVIVCAVQLIQIFFLIVMGTTLGLTIISESVRVTSDIATFQKFEELSIWSKLKYLYRMAFDNSFESTFYIRERIIINSLLSISFWLFLIFGIREIVSIIALFKFQLQIKNDDGGSSFQVYNSIVYPWFFYQVPDCLSFFILASNVSPSSGIFYRFIKPCIACICSYIPFYNDPRNQYFNVTKQMSNNQSSNIGDSEYTVDDSEHIFSDFDATSDDSSVILTPLSRSISSADTSRLSTDATAPKSKVTNRNSLSADPLKAGLVTTDINNNSRSATYSTNL